jgi:septal ring factor EnvC (AmiA/AmiB activator)
MENGKKIQMAEDIATLKVQMLESRAHAKERHDEVLDQFTKLRYKVNEEISTMNTLIETVSGQVRANRKFYIKMLVATLVVGSLIWIGESREWILSHIFSII